MAQLKLIDDVIDRLINLLEQCTEGRVVVLRNEVDFRSFRQLGLDSVTMLSFLVAVEDEFGIEWKDDVTEDTLESVGSMASYIAEEVGIAL